MHVWILAASQSSVKNVIENTILVETASHNKIIIFKMS